MHAAQESAPAAATAVLDRPASAAPVARRRRREHLRQVDLVRTATFLVVIAVHTMSATLVVDGVGVNAAFTLLHGSRYAFAFLSVFVLVHAYRDRPIRLGPFWRRRYLLIGLPYLVWSLVYIAVDVRTEVVSRDGLWTTVWQDLLSGGARYHLYFLLITAQIYLVLPALRWLLRVTAGHHRLVFGVALAGQLAVLTAVQYLPAPTSGVPAWLVAHAGSLLPTYLGMVLAAALAAWHLDELNTWVRGHGRAIRWLLLGTVLGSLAWYAGNAVLLGEPWWQASSPMQPLDAVWPLAGVLGLYALGLWWADGDRPPGAGALSWASDASFGIFLAHPLVLQFVGADLVLGADGSSSHGPATRFLLAFTLTVIGSGILVTLLRRTAFSLPLVGRPRIATRLTAPQAQPVRR